MRDSCGARDNSETRLRPHLLRPVPGAEELARWTAHDGPVVAALRQGEVIGFAAARGDTLVGPIGLPSDSGEGIGTALLDAIGPVKSLWVLAENVDARGFYEQRGWHWSGVVESCTFAGGVTKLLYVNAG